VRRVLLLPGKGSGCASVLVLEDGAGGRPRRVRHLRLVLGTGRATTGVGARWPPAELKVALEGDLLCLEYREPD
jgi:hypothetical protein